MHLPKACYNSELKTLHTAMPQATSSSQIHCLYLDPNNAIICLGLSLGIGLRTVFQCFDILSSGTLNVPKFQSHKYPIIKRESGWPSLLMTLIFICFSLALTSCSSCWWFKTWISKYSWNGPHFVLLKGPTTSWSRLFDRFRELEISWPQTQEMLKYSASADGHLCGKILVSEVLSSKSKQDF